MEGVGIDVTFEAGDSFSGCEGDTIAIEGDFNFIIGHGGDIIHASMEEGDKFFGESVR